MDLGIAPVVEPFVVQDTFATGLHDVEDMGEGLYRFTFFVKQKSTYDGQGDERVVVARLVLSTSAIFHGCKWALTAIGVKCCGAIGRAGLIH